MNLKFDDLPKAISWMMNKLKELDLKLDGICNKVEVFRKLFQVPESHSHG